MKLASLLVCAFLVFASQAVAAQTPRADVVAPLLKQDYVALEDSLAAAQRDFEAGRLTEYELRQAFEPFVKLRNAQALDNLRSWAANAPRSYVAHLAVGLNYRATGTAARGKKYWDRTTQEEREGLINNFALAEPELRKSLALTSKPYLSLVNLMTIAGSGGTRPVLNATLLLANEALPSNQLARVNYARYLLPRWGGSYAQFDAFVSTSREHGVAQSTLLKLQAMALNDRGMVLLAERDDGGAAALFTQALQVARRSGDEGRFRSVYLAASVKHVCGPDADLPECRPALPSQAGAASVAPEEQSGEDIDHAIVIFTEGRSEGVRTEYAWLSLRYPGARRTSQALIPRAGRHYDMLAFTTVDGRELKVYFDITAFYDSPL